nr:aminomethyl transferase family protein [uncultured Olsenella sp.]
MLQSELHEEHLLLGASFPEGEAPLLGPVSYVTEGADDPFRGGCALCDLTGTLVLLASGGPASSWAQAAFAGDGLAVGECSFQPALLGDGSLASIPLLGRTGDDEYAIWDLSPRSQTLSAWLSFLANVEQGGYKPYEGLGTEDVTDRLVPLALWGDSAEAVLRDYLPGEDTLPAAGRLGELLLDGRIGCLIARLPLAGEDCFLLMVPPTLVRRLWRSLLSFGSVTPVGHGRVVSRLGELLPWSRWLSQTDRVAPTEGELEGQGLLRASGDFVGARGLRS